MSSRPYRRAKLANRCKRMRATQCTHCDQKCLSIESRKPQNPKCVILHLAILHPAEHITQNQCSGIHALPCPSGPPATGSSSPQGSRTSSSSHPRPPPPQTKGLLRLTVRGEDNPGMDSTAGSVVVLPRWCPPRVADCDQGVAAPTTASAPSATTLPAAIAIV